MAGRLPVANARRVIQALKRAGFQVDRVVGSHHVMVHPADASRAVVVPFHSSRDLKPGTMRSIIRQAGFSLEEFNELLS